ncbi:hypothetical protein HDU67_009027 [Dinochytrium kinnereticum]|nr:hypothetical protein HDU67_009027 [Dinochytrium kinnereticum]
MRLTVIAASFAAALAGGVGLVSAALFEPPNGRLYLSIWHENGNPSASQPYLVKDSPVNTNLRLGRNASSYQYAQYIPLDIIPESGERNTGDLSSLERTDTDAFFFLTVYPTESGGFGTITDRDVEDLADQLYNITAPDRSNRRVFLRLYPEMNGNWYPRWHGRPIQYRREWRRVYDAVVRRGAKSNVAFVWAPNYGVGYPYGAASSDPSRPSNQFPNETEFRALDTTGDGAVTVGDDPFSPFYPGDDVVDWVGLSVYFKPFQNLNENRVPPSGQFERYMTLEGQANAVNFYDIYARAKNKPFMISESGAAFGLDDRRVVGGTPVPITCCVSRTEVFQPFWREYVTNPQTFDRYPLMKMINLFEHLKEDDLFLRDFRITANTSMQGDDAVLAAFRTDLTAVADRYIWANFTVRGAVPGPSASATVTASGTSQPTSASTTAATSRTGGASALISGVMGVVAGVVFSVVSAFM